ncbi:MAG: hypothetical protein ACAH65_01230 [Chloroflexota bacterium]
MIGNGWRRRTSAIGLASSIAVLGVVAPVAAGTPVGVHIVSHMDFNQDTFNTGDFVASGPAVDDGTFCAAGVVEDTRIILAGGQSGRGLQIPVRKTFTCEVGGTGQIFVKIQVHLDFATSTETFSWVILGGTGDFADLHGSGQGTTVSDGSDPQTGNFNTYDGFVVD